MRVKMDNNKDIRNSGILKAISYILIPIMIIVLFLCIIYSVFMFEIQEVIEKDNFYETSIFSSQFRSNINQIINKILVEKKQPQYYYIKLSSENNENIYYEGTAYYGNEDETFLYYLIKTGENNYYTNIPLTEQTDSIAKLQEQFTKKEGYYWNYDTIEDKVDTNIQNDNLDSIKYTYFNSIEKEDQYTVNTRIKESVQSRGEIFFTQKIFDISKKLQNVPITIIPFISIFLLIFVVYLCVSVGHKKGVEGIYLSNFDKKPIDIICIVVILVILIFIAFILQTNIFAFNVMSYTQFILQITVIIISYFSIYALTALILTTIIKRIKAKQLIKTTFIYKIIKTIQNNLNKLFETLSYDRKNFLKIIGFIFLNIFLIIIFREFGVFLDIIICGYAIYKLMQKVKEFKVLKNITKNIYEGNTDIEINENNFSGELKEMSIYLKDISGGFSNAINESLKSERLKTELITNVSHDIKTPLTSIINYVDLLKKENIKEEKIKEYINILDNKAQRLKKLTEDLIEASKVSSGNVKLNVENINLKELINQLIGEFKDKFEKNNLKIEINMPNENVNILADNRYMYRIMENIFSNITKYALENSRVYIDMVKKEKYVIIEIKNISKEKLNISADELMQRFVRGDKSRYTEGSGLRTFYSSKFN